MKKLSLILISVLLIILSACSESSNTSANPDEQYKDNSVLYKQAVESFGIMQDVYKNNKNLTPKQSAIIDLFQENFSEMQLLQLKLYDIDPSDDKARKDLYTELKNKTGDEYFPPEKYFDQMQSIALLAAKFDLVDGEFFEPSSSDWKDFIKEYNKVKAMMEE